MKKRLISILLTVLMVMSLFSGMSVSAYADNVVDSSYYKEYTLVEGDYVLRICQRMGIDYYTCKEAIMALNNITSENGFRYLSVGAKIKIPVSDAHAVAIMKGQSVGNVGGNIGSANGSADVAAKDAIAYYLIPYTMQRGETVLGVCNSLGINFNSNADLIQKINGIKSWSGVKAGATILLPTTKTPAVGTTCYAVLAHKVASGETAYSICQNNGINYGSSTKMLEALNKSGNLANIKAGSTFYVPVVTTIKAASSGSTNNNTSSGTTTDKNNTSTTTPAAKTYDIKANINTNYGTMKFYVNNKSVDTAAEGDKVTVDVTTKNNKAVESLVVKFEDGRADVKLESNTFIMPGCDVRVDAAISAGHDITINSNYSYKTAATVGGVSVSSATEGSSVKVVSTDPGFAVKEVEAYYSTLWGVKKTVLSVNDQFCFVMPNKDVTVEATLAPVETYNFYRSDSVNGTFDIQVDGFSVSKAAKNAKVTILWQAMTGYEIESIEVSKYNKDGTLGDSINVFNNSFTMPGCPVYVDVSFGKCVNDIEINAVEGGILYAEVNGEAASEAKTNEWVTVKGVAKENGYTANIKELIVERKADGHLVSVSGNMFQMPAGGVIISGKLESDVSNSLTVTFNSAGDGSENRVTLKADGYENWSVNDNDSGMSANYAVGTKINLSTLARDTHVFDRYEVKVNGVLDQELTDMANVDGYIKMPNADVELWARFSYGGISIPAAKISGSGKVSYMVSNDGVKFTSGNVCTVGDTVKIVADSADPNFTLLESNVTVINKATGTKLNLDNFTFKMPPEGVEISVKFTGVNRTITLNTIDATAKVNPYELQGQNMVEVSINGGAYIADNDPNGTKISVKSGDKVSIRASSLSSKKYNLYAVLLESFGSGSKYEGGITFSTTNNTYTFTMINEDITLNAYLRDKSSKTYSLTNISYNADRGTVGCAIGGINNEVVTSAVIGDIVYIVPKALEPYNIYLSGVSVTRITDNGKFDREDIEIADDKIGDGTYYPVYNNNGKLLGWKFKMPEGGVKISVSFAADENNLAMTVVDDKGNDLLSKGYVQLSIGDKLVDVTGKIDPVAYNSKVTVQMTTAGSTLYTIKSVSVTPKTTVTKNSFNMPAIDATVNVVLTAKKNVTIPVNNEVAVTSLSSDVKLYEDAEYKTALGDKADVGSTVYGKVTAKDGYTAEVKVNGTAVTVSDNKFSFTVPSTGASVEVVYTGKDVALSAANDGNGTAGFYSDASCTAAYAITSAKVGDTVYVKSFPNGGYELDSLTVDGAAVSDGDSFVVSESFSASVSFKPVQVELKAEAENGTVKFYSDKELNNEISSTASYGDTVYVKVTANAGYRLKGSLKLEDVNGTAVTVTEVSGKQSFTVPAVDVTATAEFEKIPTYKMTIDYGAGAVDTKIVVAIDGSEKDANNGRVLEVEEGAKLEFYTRSTDQYKVVKFVDKTNSKQQPAVNEIATYTMPAGDIKITVEVEAR